MINLDIYKELDLVVRGWNTVFNSDVVLDRSKISSCTTNFVFNLFLTQLSRDLHHELNDEICVCEKKENKFHVYSIESNDIVSREYGFKSKRKFFNDINNFKIIITNFPIDVNSIIRGKLILRKEVIVNLMTSNLTHFFSNELPYSAGDNKIFFTKAFENLLMSNIDKLKLMEFSSHLLNTFEIGVAIDDVILKPVITISPYGRWYWTSTEKIQNNISIRNKIYKKLLKYGKVMTIDLISGEPVIFAQLANSTLLKKLINLRINLKEKNPVLCESLKNLINIFIHAVESPKEAYNKFKAFGDISIIERELHISVIEIFYCLQEEFMCYNNSVLNDYKTLSRTELNRRIVNPLGFLNFKNEFIKEHRKYLQGHTHDKILELAMMNYNELNLLPIFTVHDSISYFINGKDAEPISNIIKLNAKKLKTPVTIETLG